MSGNRSVKPVFSMCIQSSFIIRTNNRDGSVHSAPITRIGVAHEQGDRCLPVISRSGTKMTRQNVLRTGVLSAHPVSRDYAPADGQFRRLTRAGWNVRTGSVTKSAAKKCRTSRCLKKNRRVNECEVKKAAEAGDFAAFFCPVRNIQMDERLTCPDTFDVGLTVPGPVIYPENTTVRESRRGRPVFSANRRLITNDRSGPFLQRYP